MKKEETGKRENCGDYTQKRQNESLNDWIAARIHTIPHRFTHVGHIEYDDLGVVVEYKELRRYD